MSKKEWLIKYYEILKIFLVGSIGELEILQNSFNYILEDL